MTRLAGRARTRLAGVRARLREGWGRLAPESPEPAAEAAEPAPSTPPARPSKSLSRRDLVLAGTIVGASGLAAGVLRLPVFNPPARPVTLVGEGPTLFESPRRYLASGLFPDQRAAGVAVEPPAPRVARGPLFVERRLALFNENTGESVSATYWADGDYVLEELEAIHILLRDHHADEVRAIDLRLVETLHALGKALETERPLHVLSAYRTRRTNRKLAERFHGVAVNSFHIEGKAVDVRLPGRSKRDLLRAAIALEAGGVGNYRSYVHIDTGPLRRW